MRTSKKIVLIAASGSSLLMLGALGFQYLGELAPCKLCYWQRYPHIIAILIGIVYLLRPQKYIPIFGAISAAITSGIGFYHAGVEQGYWQGPNTCTSGNITGLSTEELLNQIMQAPLVQCDAIAWSMWGISMAGWNGILSLFLMCLWVVAYLKSESL